MTAAEAIAAAVDRLTVETWRQSGWGRYSVNRNIRPGTECFLDALCKASGGNALFVEAKRAVRKAILAQFADRLTAFPAETSIIPVFNDHRDTTLADLGVVRDKAIAELGGLQ